MKKKSNLPTRYAIYLRCSTDDQRHSDYTTIDAQREINANYVNSKQGTLVKTYYDEGKTGTNLKRNGWKQLFADAQAGLFDTVVVTYMSRLARGSKYYVAEYMLEECGVSIERASQHYTDDMIGHMNKEMIIFLDGMFPKQISQWTRTKMQQMVAKGYFCGGTLPFGYGTEVVHEASVYIGSDKEPPKRLVPIVEQAEIVRHAFALYLEKRTLRAVGDYLRAVTDRVWATTTVKNLLMNEVYLGILVFGTWRNEAAYQPIVDRTTFEQVQTALGQFNPRIANGDDSFAYYLRGRVACPHCGCPYTQLSVNRGSAKRPKNRIHYYVCSKANKRKSECPVVRINAEALHYTVLNQMERAAKHHTVMHKLIAKSGGWGNADDVQKAIQAQLAKKKQSLGVQIGNISNAIAQGGNLRSLMTTLERLEREQEQVFQELQNIETEINKATVKRPTAEQVQQVWGDVIDLWDELTEEERTEALGGLLTSVNIKGKDLVHLQFNPMANVQGQMLALTSQMGAQAAPDTTINPRFSEVELSIPTGGLLRKRQRRPQDKAV